MDLRIFTEPQQGAGYERLSTLAKESERLGFGAFFVSDHLLKMGDGSARLGPTDAMTTLAGLARDTSTIRLGTLVTPITFRLPGMLAITASQIDQMSGGRLELGLGAGWFEAEHQAHGIPFPALGERFEQLAEQLEIITGFWGTGEGEHFSYDGSHYTFAEGPALPKPVQGKGVRSRGVPIVIGGGGPTKTPAFAARFGNEYNLPFNPLGRWIEQRDRVRSACEAIDRDPDELIYSVALVLCAGETEADVERRAARIGREPAELRENGAAGTIEEVREKLELFAAEGVERFYLQVLDEDDLDQVALAATLL